MARHIIRRLFPNYHAVRHHKSLQFLGTALHDPNLWHLNRRSVAGGFAVGLFVAFIPMPFQMVLAAVAAIAFGVNLPISVALVWLTNPLTMAPILFFAYKLGAWILGGQSHHVPAFALDPRWFGREFQLIWKPLLLGSLLLGSAASSIGYFGVRLFWRYNVIHRWRQRGTRRRLTSK